jgi:multiple sugar transport system permease protein
MASARNAAGSPGGALGSISRVLGGSPARTREALWGYFFLLPWLLGLVIFVVGPIIASFVLSFTEYSILSTPKFVGVQNYVQAFTKDDLLWPSVGRTFIYAAAIVPLGVLGSLILAILLNQKLVGTAFYRTLFFMANLIPVVASAILWIWVLQPKVGPTNYLLSLVGIQGPGWLGSPDWALPSVILIGLWGSLGGQRMIIFLAGLQGVPQELYEAADIDGANQWHKFRNVTLPMISPTMLFNVILGVIGALQVFNIAYVATAGGPSYATWFFALHIYRQAFEYFRMGYGSALAWLFAIMLLVFTYIQMRTSSRWVYYAGEK